MSSAFIGVQNVLMTEEHQSLRLAVPEIQNLPVVTQAPLKFVGPKAQLELLCGPSPYFQAVQTIWVDSKEDCFQQSKLPKISSLQRCNLKSH